jgi:hypothetical protein
VAAAREPVRAWVLEPALVTAMGTVEDLAGGPIARETGSVHPCSFTKPSQTTLAKRCAPGFRASSSSKPS